FNVSQNMNTNVGMHKTDTVGGDHTEMITGSKTLSIGINFVLIVLGNMFEWITGNKEVQGKDIKETAQEVLLSSTEKSISLKGSKDVNSHSGENSRNY
ncbi:type IV secretion protein Rhs, partial [Flavobacterium sp. LBUM151]